MKKRFRELHELNIFNTRFAQYNRKYIVDLYDNFHKRKKFLDQFVNMYSKRIISQFFRRRTQNVDINENFNVFLKLNFNDDDEKIENDDDVVAKNFLLINEKNFELKTQKKIDLTIYDENNFIDVISNANEKNENINYDNIVLLDVVNQKLNEKAFI